MLRRTFTKMIAALPFVNGVQGNTKVEAVEHEIEETEPAFEIIRKPTHDCYVNHRKAGKSRTEILDGCQKLYTANPTHPHKTPDRTKKIPRAGHYTSDPKKDSKPYNTYSEEWWSNLPPAELHEDGDTYYI